MDRLTAQDWAVINTALAFYEAEDLSDEAERWAGTHPRYVPLYEALFQARDKVGLRVWGRTDG